MGEVLVGWMVRRTPIANPERGLGTWCSGARGESVCRAAVGARVEGGNVWREGEGVLHGIPGRQASQPVEGEER
jgi:hypothetical protein